MLSFRSTISVFALSLLAGCSLVHDDVVVARVGNKKLYKTEVLKFIPPGSSTQDSLRLATQYINAWAGELVMNRMATKFLSKAERDVSEELAEYKNSLLQYRYEQHYINDRLDTVVTEDAIRKYFEDNKSLFVLATPIVKARYICVPSTMPAVDEVKSLLTSADARNAGTLDSLSHTVAAGYADYSGQWVDIVVVARNFGVDYATLISSLKNGWIDITDGQGMEHIAYVLEYLPSGKLAPLEFCHDKIKDMIVEQRKYALSITLEQTLLEEARSDGFFEIYETDEK